MSKFYLNLELFLLKSLATCFFGSQECKKVLIQHQVNKALIITDTHLILYLKRYLQKGACCNIMETNHFKSSHVEVNFEHVFNIDISLREKE